MLTWQVGVERSCQRQVLLVFAWVRSCLSSCVQRTPRVQESSTLMPGLRSDSSVESTRTHSFWKKPLKSCSLILLQLMRDIRYTLCTPLVTRNTVDLSNWFKFTCRVHCMASACVEQLRKTLCMVAFVWVW